MTTTSLAEDAAAALTHLRRVEFCAERTFDWHLGRSPRRRIDSPCSLLGAIIVATGYLHWWSLDRRTVLSGANVKLASDALARCSRLVWACEDRGYPVGQKCAYPMSQADAERVLEAVASVAESSVVA